MRGTKVWFSYTTESAMSFTSPFLHQYSYIELLTWFRMQILSHRQRALKTIESQLAKLAFAPRTKSTRRLINFQLCLRRNSPFVGIGSVPKCPKRLATQPALNACCPHPRASSNPPSAGASMNSFDLFNALATISTPKLNPRGNKPLQRIS